MSLKELSLTYWTRLTKINKELEKIRPEVCFNAGCGDGFQDKFYSVYAKKIISVDLNKGDIFIAKMLNEKLPITYSVADLSQPLNLVNNSVDVIICSEVLEHLQNDDLIIKEFSRILKQGGHLILTVPHKNFPFFYDPINFVLNRFGEKKAIGIWSWGHQRLYSQEDLNYKFSKEGLDTIKVKILSHYLTSIIENGYLNSWLQRLVKNDPSNQAAISSNLEKIKKRALSRPPIVLRKIRDLLIKIDENIFNKSKYGVGLFLVLKKTKNP